MSLIFHYTFPFNLNFVMNYCSSSATRAVDSAGELIACDVTALRREKRMFTFLFSHLSVSSPFKLTHAYLAAKELQEDQCRWKQIY